MGSDAEIYIFDDVMFTDHVVPTIDDYVRTGQRPEWLDLLLKRLVRVGWSDIERNARLGFSFHDVCAYLDDTFAYPSAVEDWSTDWGERACRSTECPARTVCPLHDPTNTRGAEEFTTLI